MFVSRPRSHRRGETHVSPSATTHYFTMVKGLHGPSGAGKKSFKAHANGACRVGSCSCPPPPHPTRAPASRAAHITTTATAATATAATRPPARAPPPLAAPPGIKKMPNFRKKSMKGVSQRRGHASLRSDPHPRSPSTVHHTTATSAPGRPEVPAEHEVRSKAPERRSAEDGRVKRRAGTRRSRFRAGAGACAGVRCRRAAVRGGARPGGGAGARSTTGVVARLRGGSWARRGFRRRGGAAEGFELFFFVSVL